MATIIYGSCITSRTCNRYAKQLKINVQIRRVSDYYKRSFKHITYLLRVYMNI